MAGERDHWAEWVAGRRPGGDSEKTRRFSFSPAATRDKVLERAGLQSDETLLDVGCGEGLIAFGALERGAKSVVFADVSTELLDRCRRAASELSAQERCRFVEASADNLGQIPDGSVDVVTTRSVLIYVADKAAAFAEFARVLRPGGRISLFEPINRYAQLTYGPESFVGYDLGALPEIGAKLRALFASLQPPETDPMFNFDERDLIRLAEEAGFFPLRLDLEVVVELLPAFPWERFLKSASNPNIPTIGEAMERALTEDERERLTSHLRPMVEQGRGQWRLASAFLAGTNSPS